MVNVPVHSLNPTSPLYHICKDLKLYGDIINKYVPTVLFYLNSWNTFVKASWSVTHT